MTQSRVGSRSNPLLAWAVLIVAVMARAYRALVLTLIAAAVVPSICCSWHSYLVRTGSMRPALSIGDVVVASPIGSATAVPLGRVMVFVSPATGRTTVHRVVAKASHGQFSTAGDANPSLDPAAVPRNAFHDQARLRIPFIGLPVMWLSTGNLAALIGWLVITAAAFFFSIRGGPPRRPRAGPRQAPPSAGGAQPDGTLRTPRRGRLTGRLATVVVTVSALMVAFAATATAAAFTSSTRNSGDGWGVTTAVQQPYTKQVVDDHPYFFYRVDEANGAGATDTSGNSRPGTYSAISAYRQPGALPNNPGYSVALSGTAHILGGGTALSDPATFTLELWFKTSSTSGGKLIGFNNTNGVNSLLYDRQIFMRTDGRLVYGGWLGGTTTTTPKAYNDDKWHYLVLTATALGFQQQSVNVYVDNANVASNTTAVLNYSGYWQIGYGPLPSGIGYPNSSFSGNVDNVAVYQTALTAARISAHYASR